MSSLCPINMFYFYNYVFICCVFNHIFIVFFILAIPPHNGLIDIVPCTGTSPHPLPSNSAVSNIKLSCDRHLLAAAHNNIQVGPVLAVLKVKETI